MAIDYTGCPVINAGCHCWFAGDANAITAEFAVESGVVNGDAIRFEFRDSSGAVAGYDTSVVANLTATGVAPANIIGQVSCRIQRVSGNAVNTICAVIIKVV